MVSVVKRPQGHKLIDQAIAASITDEGGDALITFPYHSLSGGDYVYITSDIDEYNGFWYVTVIDVNSFKISELDGGLGTLVFTPWFLNALPLWGISDTSAQAWFWTGGIAVPFLTVPAGIVAGDSDWFGPTGVAFETGRTYKYGYTFTAFSDITDAVEIKIVVGDGAFAVLTQKVESTTATVAGQVVIGTFEFVAPSGALRFAVVVNYPSGAANDGTIEVNSFVDLTEDVYEGGADFMEYYQDLEIDYYQTQEHDWSAIFLPIIYKISSDRWPVNTVDLVRTVLFHNNDNGFTQLTLTGDIKSGVNALEFVEITGGSDVINGVWQIVEVISASDLVLSLPYDSGNSFSGVSVQYYYNNYQVKVKIFAGLNASHPWANKKPYEEVAELSLTPDENNLVMFSVSDYIQSKVQIKNNLTLFSLPLNLDAFTGFKIQIAESYDDSDNYILFTTESSFIEDDFEGYAVAGKLPFKNLYAGDYAEYIYTSGSPAKWLTIFERLLAVEGYFFDVSFIKNVEGEFFIRFTKYFTQDYSVIEDVEQVDHGIGVYRIPITPDVAYESFCIVARTHDVPEHTEIVVTPFNLSEGLNYDLGAPGGYDRWTLGPIPEQDISASNQVIPIYWPFQVANGVSYTFQYTIEITTPNVDTEIRISLRDTSEPYSGTTSAGEGTKTHVGTGVFTDTITIVSTGTTPDVSLNVSVESLAYSVRLTAFGTAEETFFPAVVGVAITEEICIDILEVCEVEGGFTPEGRRLTEDGGFRLLE